MAQMGKDLHNNIGFGAGGVHAVAIGTTGTGQTAGPVDLSGYGGVEFIVDYGTISSTTAVFTALMTESDATGSGFTSVADADMFGTEATAVPATGTRVSGTNKNVSKRIGYQGNKRYVKLKVSSLATAGTPIAIVPIMHNPRRAPVA